MCKFGFNFCNYISVCPCTGQSRIVPEQSKFNETLNQTDWAQYITQKILMYHIAIFPKKSIVRLIFISYSKLWKSNTII